MNNKGKFKALIKPLSLVCLSSLLAVTLTSCEKADKLYTGLNPDEKYLTLDKYSVTNKELYDEMRWNATTFVDDKIGDILTERYMDKVVNAIENPKTVAEKKLHKKYVEQIQEKIICEIFNITDIETQIDTLKNNPYQVREALPKFVDSVYQNKGINLGLNLKKNGELNTSSDVYLELYKFARVADILTSDKDFELGVYGKGEESKAASDEYGVAYYNGLSKTLKSLLKEYYRSIAEWQYAYDYLADEIKEYNEDAEENGEDPYFSDEEIKTYWKNNYESEYDTRALIIRFTNQDEANQVYKAFGLKTYRNQLYYINDYVYRDTNGDGQPEDDYYTESEYSKHYDEYDFTKQVSHDAEAILLSGEGNEALVLAIFLEMYNYVYSYRAEQFNHIVEVNNSKDGRRDVVSKLIDKFGARGDYYGYTVENVYEQYMSEQNFTGYKDFVEYTNDELKDINSGLQTYIHNTLVLDSANSSKNKRYTTTAQSYGSGAYLVFKCSEDVIEDKNTLYFTDDVEKDEIDMEKSKELVEEIIEELKDDILNDTYIQNALTEGKADVEVKIYDEALEISYQAGNADYKKTRGNAPKDGVILVLNYVHEYENAKGKTVKDEYSSEYTSLDLWNEYEPIAGVSTAVDIISKKVVMDSPEFKEVKADEEKTELFYDNLDSLLTSFTADNMSSYGYPSSIGKYSFLMMYFHTADIDQVIDTYYRLNEASSRMINDFTSSDLATFLKKYTDNYYEKHFSLDATNLLVYVDMDEDGEPDRDFDWGKELKTEVTINGTTCKTYSDLAIAFIRDVIKLVKYSADTDVNTINSIVSEFNSSSRFEKPNNEDYDDRGEYNPTESEKYWAKYRKAGLLVKTESLTGITNDSTYGAVNDVLKLALYEAYQGDYLYNGEVTPNEYLVSKHYNTNESGLFNVNGYNLPVITKATINQSAKFTQEEDDKDGLYTNLVFKYNDQYYTIDNIYSEIDPNNEKVEELLTTKQITAYLLEQAAGDGSILPSVVSTALSSYLSPVYSKFTSETSQFVVLTSLLKSRVNGEFVFNKNNEGAADRFNAMVAISQRIEDGYSDVIGYVYEGLDVEYTYFKGQTSNPLDVIGDLYELDNENWWTSLEEYVLSRKEGK